MPCDCFDRCLWIWKLLLFLFHTTLIINSRYIFSCFQFHTFIRKAVNVIGFIYFNLYLWYLTRRFKGKYANLVTKFKVKLKCAICRRELKKSRFVFRIAICRGKREKSRFVTENGKNRDSARAAISFCPWMLTVSLGMFKWYKELKL